MHALHTYLYTYIERIFRHVDRGRERERDIYIQIQKMQRDRESERERERDRTQGACAGGAYGSTWRWKRWESPSHVAWPKLIKASGSIN